MYKAFKEKIESWILEIGLVVFVAIGTFIWGLHLANTDQNVINVKQQATIDFNSGRITNLEEKIESFRKENREDHKEILAELKEVIKK